MSAEPVAYSPGDTDHQDYIKQLAAKAKYIFRAVKGDGAIVAHGEIDFRESNKTRMERSLSWLRRELELARDDPDISFICHWISFEALYSNDIFLRQPPSKLKLGESSLKRIEAFIEKVVQTDDQLHRKRLCASLERVWPGVVNLMANEYISPGNWRQYYSGTTKAGVKHNPFSSNVAHKPRKSVLKDPNQLLTSTTDLFQRLYYLRNMVFHGNATYKGQGKPQRSEQIRDGMGVMRRIVPVLVEIMLDEMEGDIGITKWGLVPYPRIKEASAAAAT